MSPIIPADAVLLSPLADSFSLYSPSPSPMASYSPVLPPRMLKSLSAVDSSEPEARCFPTHQVFNFPERANSLAPMQERPCLSIDPSLVTAVKRAASPAPSLTKKPRILGERINTKDFVPPDVSGLSKREARLVKNRAAAFLSRQRKREEFETMEIRVAELERENARLLSLTQTGNTSNTQQDLASEVEDLRAQLAAAKERETQLAQQLVTIAAAPPAESPLIKVEESVASEEQELSLPSSPRSSTPLKTGASLGLMVLLCALPTLLSMPMHTALPTSFALPNPPFPAASAAFDFNSFLPNDYDWTIPSMNTMMDIDDFQTAVTPLPVPARKLELSTSGVSELDVEGGLTGLDISFDAKPSDDGKIRVRIHPSSSVSSRATSPGPSMLSDSDVDCERNGDASFLSSSSLSALSSSLAQLSYPPPSSPDGDPFLGVGESSDSSNEDIFGFDDLGSEHSYAPNETSKKRVRIALKSLPKAGGEGGEWEVQVC